MSKSEAYFVSDAHLGIRLSGYDQREPDLLSFLRSIAGHASHLFILGDLFDFWIEYGTLIRSEYFEAVRVLRELVESGTEVHYMAGNHDFALGPFLPRYAGIQIHLGHWDTEVQGKRLHLFHGDGVIKADVGYRVLRTILRSPLNQSLFKTLIPPSLGIKLATGFSGSSRKYLGFLLTDHLLQEYRDCAKSYLDRGSDIVVFGHTHRAELCVEKDKTYCNTGEWIRRYTYATLREGVMQLWQHTPGTEPQAVASRALNPGSSVS